jgi:hypothetical protein
LAQAQQNGITAIILALWVEKSCPGAVAILGPAVVVVNLLHALGTRVQKCFDLAPMPSAGPTRSDVGIPSRGRQDRV